MTQNIENYLASIIAKRLRNGVHYVYAQEYCDDCQDNALIAESCKPQIDNLKTAVDTEGEAYDLLRSSELTEKINIDIDRRRLLVKGLFGLADYAQASADANVAASGKRMRKALEKYKQGNSERNVDETGNVAKVAKKLQSTCATDLENIGGTKLVNDLITVNENVYENNRQRTNNQEVAKGMLDKARKATDDALRDLRNHILVAVIKEGEQKCRAVLDELNGLTARIKRDNGYAKNVDEQEEQEQHEQPENNQEGKDKPADAPKDGKTELQPENGNGNSAPATEAKENAPEKGSDEGEKEPLKPAQ